MQTLTQPTLLLKPFAESGDKNTLPDVNTDLSNPQNADLTNGFPQITSMSPSDGGLPPQRKDFNGLGYLTTTYDFFYQAGGTFTFDPTISTAIGGYPLGARLWYTNSNGVTMILRSTVANNTDNFNDGDETGIGTTWVSDTPTLGGNNGWTGTNTFAGSVELNGTISGSNSVKETITGWGMPNYDAEMTRTHGTTYQASTNLLFCYSCDSSEYTDSFVQVSKDGLTWISLGQHHTVGGGGNDKENVGQVFIPKGWYYRSYGGGSSICTAFPLIGG